MLISEVKKLTPMERFLYWIEEREAIRSRKERGLAKPYTDDEILQSYRFTNVRRMDDKVSLWLLNNWYNPNFNHKNMLPAAAMARHFNKPEALAAIGFPVRWTPEGFKTKLRALKASGQTIFNGAYMVRGIGEVDKTEMVVTKVVQPLVDNPPGLDTSSMEKCWNALLPYWGFSSFMAGQVVADLRHAMEGNWEDVLEWAPAGPGSMRGLNRLHGRDVKKPLTQEQVLKELRELFDLCIMKLPVAITSRLELMDIQNCCCETDKYNRVFEGRRPKQRYAGI